MIELAARQKLIRDFPCFSKLTQEELSILARLAEEAEFEQGQTIVNQGDPVDAVYLIFQGMCEVFVQSTESNQQENILVATLTEGESIGLNEIGFFSKTGFRTATVIAKNKVELLRISMQNFHQFLTQHSNFNQSLEQSSRQMLLISLLKKIVPFQKLSDETILRLSKKIKDRDCKAGEMIFSKGDIGDYCYFIAEGKVEIFNTNDQGEETQLAQLGKSSLFGEVSLLTNTPRTASARAVENCKFIVVDADDLNKLMFAENSFSANISQTVMERARPLINKDIIIQHYQTDDNEPVVTLKNDHQETYYQLTRQGWFVYQQLNGKKNLQQISLLFQKEFRTDSNDFVYNLIVDLVKGGFAFYTGERKVTEPRVTVISYDSKEVFEESSIRFEDVISKKRKSKITWVHVEGLTNVDLIQKIAHRYHLNPLTVRDIFDVDQRSKIEELENYAYVSLKMLYWNDESKKFSVEHVSLIFSKDFVLTFQESDKVSLCESMKGQFHTKTAHRLLDKGTDYLIYRLVDLIVEQYFSIIENMNENLEQVEEMVLAAPTQKHARYIYDLKRQMFVLRKTVWPVRETVSQLQHVNSDLVTDFSKLHFKDLYDHTAQAMDSLSLFRDRLVGLLDIYLSSLSNRMNEVMKVLTIIATTFIPVTCVATILGMNFDHMTIYHWYWGYPVAIGLMLIMTFGMIAFFRWKKWI